MAELSLPADSARSNVVPFRGRISRPAYAPGVTPFDPTNLEHIRAWNTLFALGWAEQRFAEKERRERSGREEV